MNTTENTIQENPKARSHFWRGVLAGAPKDQFKHFNLEYTKLLTTDYVHKKLFTGRYRAQTPNFAFHATGVVDLQRVGETRDHPNTSLEVKMITKINGNKFEARFNEKDQIRLWASFGPVVVAYNPLIVTSKLKTTNTFDRLSGYLCAEYQGTRFHTITRLDLKEGLVPYMNEKITYTYKRCQVGYTFKYNIRTFDLERYNFFLAYRRRQYAFFAEHISKNKTQIELGKILFGAIYRTGGIDYALKASYRPYKERPHTIRLKLGMATDIHKDCTLRAKINNRTKLTLSSRYRYSPNLSVIASTQMTLMQPETFFINKRFRLPFGVSVEYGCD